MRKFVALALAVVTLTFGVPASMLAQTAVSLRGSITGEAVDAGGRAVAGQRVELVQTGQVVQATITGSNGRFTFTNVPEGDYIVRVLVNGQPAGVRVSLAPGAAMANALIVTPSAAAPSAANWFNYGSGSSGAGGVWIPVVFTAIAATVGYFAYNALTDDDAS